MRKIILIVAAVVCVASLAMGCARMQVGGTKEPIKVDIAMRLDIYQHVEKDIDAIEDIVSGGKPAKKAGQQGSLLRMLVNDAYAQEGLSPEVEQAALRRKDRLAELSSLEAQGVIGENKDALVEVRGAGAGAAAKVAGDENADRMIIYQALAAKNGTSVAEVQKLYAKKLQGSAPSGTPLQAPDGSWSAK